MLVRLLALVALGLVVFGLVSAFKRMAHQREQRRQTYRPDPPPQQTAERGRQPSGKSQQRPDAVDVAVLSKADAAKRRDGLTGELINPAERVYQCTNCQTLYHETSVQALVGDMGGRCMQCQSTERVLVVFSEP